MRFYLNGVRICIDFGIFIVIALSIILNNSNIAFLLLFSAFHEIGHIICLYAFGGRAESINISFYGIGLKHNSVFKFHQELIFLISGVVVNYTFFALNIHRDINIMLAIINTLPIYPLDGGRALKLILNKKLTLQISDKVYFVISVITLAFLILFSFVTKSFNLLIIALYIVFYSINNAVD